MCRKYLVLIALCAITSSFYSYSSDCQADALECEDDVHEYRNGEVISIVTVSEPDSDEESEKKAAASDRQVLNQSADSNSDIPGISFWGRVASGITHTVYGHTKSLLGALESNSFNQQYPGVDGVNIRNRAMAEVTAKKSIDDFLKTAELYKLRHIEPTEFERTQAAALKPILRGMRKKELDGIRSLLKKRQEEIAEITRTFDEETQDLGSLRVAEVTKLTQAMTLFGIEAKPKKVLTDRKGTQGEPDEQ